MPTQILKTVKPSGGDYTSLAAAITALAQDLVAADKYLTIQIDGDWSGGPDTSIVTINGYTTDVTHYIEIYTVGTAKHTGKYDATKYRLEASNDALGVLNLGVGCNYLRITGLQIKNTYSSNAYDTAHGIYVNFDSSLSDIRFDKVIVQAPQHAFRGAFDTIVQITNSIFICLGASGHNTGEAINTRGHTTVLNCILAILSSSGTSPVIESIFYTCDVKNCYAYNAGSGAAYGAALTLTTCASHDGSGSVSLQSIAYSISGGAFFTSVTPGSEDYHLRAGSALTDHGTDLSATFTDDIDGTVRTTPWDIGIANATASSSSSSCRSSSSSSRSSSSSSSSRSSSSSSCSSSSRSSSSCSSSSCRSSSSSSSCRSSSSSSSCSSSSSRSSSSSSRSSSSSSCSSSSRSSSSSSSSCRSSSSSSCSSSSSRSSSSSSCRSSSSSCSSRSSSSSSCRSSSSCSSSSSAYLGALKNYTRTDVNGLPVDTSDLATIFSGGEYVQVQFVDGVRVSQTSVQTHACFLFKDRYASNIPFQVTWVGQSNKACSVAPIILQIFNRTLVVWETLDQNTTAPANTNVTLQGTKISTIADYYDVNHEIACRVYQQAT